MPDHSKPRLHAAIAHLAAVRQHRGDDGLRAADHLLGRAPRERQHQDARRIDAVQHEMRGAMRQRVGLAGAGAGQDQQRAGADALVLDAGVPKVAARRCCGLSASNAEVVLAFIIRKLYRRTVWISRSCY